MIEPSVGLSASRSAATLRCMAYWLACATSRANASSRPQRGVASACHPSGVVAASATTSSTAHHRRRATPIRYPIAKSPRGMAAIWRRIHPNDEPKAKVRSSKARTAPKTATPASGAVSRRTSATTKVTNVSGTARGATWTSCSAR